VSARTVTLEWAGGQTGTFKVRPEVTRFDEIVAGDVVQIDVEQQLRLEYQPPGIASVPYTVGGSGQGTVAMAGGSISSTAIESTVTVTAIDRDRRRVRFQDPAGATYEVTAGTGVELEKLKVGDRLLATYVEATAVRLEKPARKP
jgi:hypothetical protein